MYRPLKLIQNSAGKCRMDLIKKQIVDIVVIPDCGCLIFQTFQGHIRLSAKNA